jgi:NAD+ kinase
VEAAPVLGVNSDPEHSLGLFCGATEADFAQRLRAALAGKLKAVRLARLGVRINGRPVPERALNEVLFSRRDPAAMARYRLAAGGRTEEQRSSGLWISTAAGSTAAIRAAGGRRMPLTDERLQLVAREPYRRDGRPYHLERLTTRRPVRVQALTGGAAIWIDGEHVRYGLAYGDVVEVRPDGPPLTVLGHDEARRRRLFP